MRDKRVLVADDEEVQRNILGDILTSSGFDVELADGAPAAIERFDAARAREVPFGVVLSDLKMPHDREGLDLLEAVKRSAPDTSVVLMTAYASVQSAVRAMKLGALDYLPKPFDKEQLLHVVEQAFEKRELHQENARLKEAVRHQSGVRRIVGESAGMKELFRVIDRVAATTTNCLIRGESGTGKELVAKAIHYGGPRAGQPFVAINCAAIPETLIESELFGHEKGVFTGASSSKAGRFEEVGEGTLFLDEIGSMRVDLQTKLLRVIQEREFSRLGSSTLLPFRGRILAATATDLEEAIRRDEFREDLFYRLNVVAIRIPPLRERVGDIPALVDHFIARCSERNGVEPKAMDDRALEIMKSYSWPGNVRELENCIERMIVLGETVTLSASDLPAEVRGDAPIPHAAPAEADGVELPPQGVVLEEMEANLIRQAIERTGGRLEPAAQLLGITYKTLQYRIKKHDLGDVLARKREGQ